MICLYRDEFIPPPGKSFDAAWQRLLSTGSGDRQQGPLFGSLSIMNAKVRQTGSSAIQKTLSARTRSKVRSRPTRSPSWLAPAEIRPSRASVKSASAS